jgi:hypothetical protein
MAAVYADLDGDLKRRLSESSFYVNRISVQSIAKRYAVAPHFVEETCERFRLPVSTSPGGVRYVMIFKPSVLEHPVTKRAALSVNLSLELQGFASEIHRLFASDYSVPGWSLHRFMWSHIALLMAIRNAGVLVLGRLRALLRRSALTAPPFASSAAANLSVFARLGSAFSADDVRTLTGLVRKYFTNVRWHAGDVMLLDNLRVAHTGMPGFGPRELRALLLNPIFARLNRLQSF